MNETVNQENLPTTEQQEPRTFTQNEVNSIVADRLTRERAKYADYDDLKAKAQQFDTTKAQLDELNRAQARTEMLGRVSAATGVPAELLTGETEEECTAQAQAIAKFARPGYPKVRDGGDPRHANWLPDYAAEAFKRDKKHTPKPCPDY